jgi:hypothetical protein
MLNQTITTIYDNYIEEMSAALSEEARHLGGLSRMISGKRGKSDELLPTFDSRLEAELNRLFSEQPDSGEVRELADYMLSQISESKDEPRLKYSFMAVQRHLAPLICYLNQEDADYLFKKSETVIRRQERFPVQKDLMKKLKEQSHK